MGVFVLLSLLACVVAWFQRNLSLATKVILSLIYAGSWLFVNHNQYLTVGIQIYCIYAVVALFVGQRVWLHFWRPKPVAETVDGKES
jgi:hypothetical protein